MRHKTLEIDAALMSRRDRGWGYETRPFQPRRFALNFGGFLCREKLQRLVFPDKVGEDLIGNIAGDREGAGPLAAAGV